MPITPQSPVGPGESPSPTAASLAPTEEHLDAEEQRILLEKARQAVEAAIRQEPMPSFPADAISPRLLSPRGCFVTLTWQGRLRGCIGHVFPDKPLCQVLLESARSAATADRRFDPITPQELPNLELEVSVLTAPRLLHYTDPADLLQQLEPDRHGVVMRIGHSMATYLPQVWAQLPDKEDFLDRLCEKAGRWAGDWRKQGVEILLYEVQHFGGPLRNTPGSDKRS